MSEFDEKRHLERFATDFYKPHGRQRDIVSGRCEGRVSSDWSSYQCENKGKYDEQGHKWCGIHAPTKRTAKERKGFDKRQARYARWDIINARKQADIKIIEVAKAYFRQKASHDDLEAAVMDAEKWHDTPLKGDE